MRYLKLFSAFIIPIAVLILLASTLLAYTYEIGAWVVDVDGGCLAYNEHGCWSFHMLTTAHVYFTPTVTSTAISLVMWPDSHNSGLTIYAPVGCPGGHIDYSYEDILYYYSNPPFTTTFYSCSLPASQIVDVHLDRNWSFDDYHLWKILYESDYPPIGGWPACSTVDNADFDTSSDWTLSGGASIAGSVLTLPTAGAVAQQDFLIQSNFYTVTAVVKRLSSVSTDTLVLAMATDGGHVAASDPFSLTADGVFHEVQTTVTPDTTGDGTLAILNSGGSYQVDYICVEATFGQNTCTTENQVFNFEQGYNNEASLTSWGWGFSQGWKGIDYPPGGYAGDRAVWSVGHAGGGFETASMFAAKQEATIQFNYLVVPHIITVTPRAGMQIQILTSPDAFTWAIVDTASFAGGEVVTFAPDYAAPVYLAVAALSDTGIPIFNTAGIEQVEMDACYGGSNTFSDCVVGDPDFDISDGYPSHFYWYGGYTAVPGAAVLEQSGDLNQMITPPWAGPYTLEIVASSDNTEQPCSWQVEFTNYGSSVEVTQAPVQCGQGTEYAYSVPFILPAQSLVLWIKQTSGESSISRVCLTPSAGPGQCLNLNPDMQGVAGYTGSWYSNEGHVTVRPDGKLAAIGVQYSAAEPPYLLNLIVSPAFSGTIADTIINRGEIPGGVNDEDHTITQTAYLTYSLYNEISGGFGPTIWNLGDGSLVVQRYCITQATGVITNPFPPEEVFECGAVQNADFESGLAGWENSNVIAVNGIASFAGGGYISQNLGSFSGPITATIRLLLDAYAVSSATLTVASDYTPTIVSHDLIPGHPAFYEDAAIISGTTVITISAGVSSGPELDFACLYPGGTCAHCIAPPLPSGPTTGTVTIPPGGALAECIAPPMGLLPGNITDTLSTVWPWGVSPTNFETMMAYNTGWVRYIGCTLDNYYVWMKDEFWGDGWRLGGIGGGDGLHAHLDNIIFLLATLNLLGLLQGILALLQTLGVVADAILDNLIDVGKSLLFIFGLGLLAVLALIGLLILIAAIIALIWQIPQEFWASFRNAATGTGAVALPIPASEDDPLHNILVGIQLVNQVAGETYIFPVVIIAIVVGSIGILIWTIKQFSIDIV